VGQTEFDIEAIAHTTLLVLVPDIGDYIQILKAGILEIADIFVINKSDRDGAEATHNDLQNMISLAQQKYKQRHWEPPIVKTQALRGEGLSALIEETDRHIDSLHKSVATERAARKKDQVREVLAEMLKDRILEKVMDNLASSGEFDRNVEAILNGTLDPYTVCDNLVRDTLGIVISKSNTLTGR